MSTLNSSKIFVFDPIHSEMRKRKVSLSGQLVTISLENYFWDILAELASNLDKSTDQLISELFSQDGDQQVYDYRNAMLRAICLAHVRKTVHNGEGFVVSEPWYRR